MAPLVSRLAEMFVQLQRSCCRPNVPSMHRDHQPRWPLNSVGGLFKSFSLHLCNNVLLKHSFFLKLLERKKFLSLHQMCFQSS